MMKAPIECEAFQIDILVASSLGGTQCVIRRLHGGKPHPWNMLFRISSTPNRTTSVWTNVVP